MIPIIYRRYPGAVLATIISFLSTGFYTIALFFIVGYVLNWDGLRDELSLPGALLAGACFAAIGFGLGKLAEFLAKRKAAARAMKEAARTSVPAAEQAYTTSYRPAEPPRTAAPVSGAGNYCPACGARILPIDRFCTNCGNKLS